MIEDLKEEVYKCSKCGLCKSVCPIYLSERNEIFLPRGRYIILNNFFNNNKKLSKRFIKDLDICLNCNLCKTFCPSSIDMAKINTDLKFKYNKSFNPFNILIKIIFFRYKLCSLLYRMFPFKSLFIGTHIDNLYGIKINKNKTNNQSSKKGKILLFEGCYNHYINPSDKNATINILEKIGYEVITPKFMCCGYPLLSEGNIKDFKKNALNLIKEYSKECTNIVCTCDTCLDTLKKIRTYNADNQNIVDKLITLDKFLEKEEIHIEDNNNIYCHMPIIRSENVYLPKSISIINKKGVCTLMENFFCFKHPKYSKKILDNTFYNKEELDEKIIITTCLISKLGLIEGFRNKKIKNRVLSYAEFIERNEK